MIPEILALHKIISQLMGGEVFSNAGDDWPVGAANMKTRGYRVDFFLLFGEGKHVTREQASFTTQLSWIID